MKDKKVPVPRPPVVDISKIRKIDDLDVKNTKQSNNGDNSNNTHPGSQLAEQDQVSSPVYGFPSPQSSPPKLAKSDQ